MRLQNHGNRTLQEGAAWLGYRSQAVEGRPCCDASTGNGSRLDLTPCQQELVEWWTFWNAISDLFPGHILR